MQWIRILYNDSGKSRVHSGIYCTSSAESVKQMTKILIEEESKLLTKSEDKQTNLSKAYAIKQAHYSELVE